jgi:hypothetical protein
MCAPAPQDLDTVPTVIHAGDDWAVLEYTMSFTAMMASRCVTYGSLPSSIWTTPA